MKELFADKGNWFKGNLHTHTTLSDGRLSPEEVIDLYKSKGYEFLALTDHWVMSRSERKNGMLMISGCEYDTGDMVNMGIFHIVGVGMERPVNLKHIPLNKPQDIIDAVVGAGGEAILAHPCWSVMDPGDIKMIHGFCGAEIFNSTSDLPANGRRADSGVYFDIWGNAGRLVNCMAADDSHNYSGEQTKSFIMVNAAELTKEAIMQSIHEGNYYASQGPRIDSVTFDSNKIRIKCPKVKTVVFYSNTVWCEDRVFTGGVEEAEYKIKDTDKYVRIELIDDSGRMAWTSPVAVNNR
jgi:hypothetical protein